VNFLEDVFPKKISKRLAKAYFRFSVSKSAIRFKMEQAFTRLKDCTAYLSLSVEIINKSNLFEGFNIPFIIFTHFKDAFVLTFSLHHI